MSIVNFTIPKQLERRVASIIKEKGFGSKAEFFRFAAIYFIDVMQKPTRDEDAKTAYLSHEIAKEAAARYGNKKLPSAREQLKNL